MKKGIAWLAACMLILVLAACGGANQSADSGSNGSDAGVTASEELVIKASNYEFEQPEYHLKKVSRLTLFMKM